MNSTEKDLKLQRIYDYAITRYGEDSVLGVFVNNDPWNKTSKYILVLIPTLEELCFTDMCTTIEIDKIVFQGMDITNFVHCVKYNTEEMLLNTQYHHMYEHFFKDADNNELIKQGVIYFIRERMESTNNYKTFSKSLTFAEIDALEKIIDTIGGIQGIVSINSLSKETGISRPVFNNLLNKMENTKVAIIQNMGAKGTYIKFINQTLLKERGK